MKSKLGGNTNNMKINTKVLKKLLTATQNEIIAFVKQFVANRGYEYTDFTNAGLYVEGTVPVTIIAHCDTAGTIPPLDTISCKHGMVYLDSRRRDTGQVLGGDDRCGVYIALSFLSRESNRPNILLTRDEEIGCVGAKSLVNDDWSNEKGENIDTLEMLSNTNFFLQCDRRGFREFVLYDCDNDKFTEFIKGFGFLKETGSFSDINTISNYTGICGANLSAGFYSEHSKDEYISLSSMSYTLDKVNKLVDAGARRDKPFLFDPPAYGRWNGWGGTSYGKKDKSKTKKKAKYVYRNGRWIPKSEDAINQGMIYCEKEDKYMTQDEYDEWKYYAWDYLRMCTVNRHDYFMHWYAELDVVPLVELEAEDWEEIFGKNTPPSKV